MQCSSISRSIKHRLLLQTVLITALVGILLVVFFLQFIEDERQRHHTLFYTSATEKLATLARPWLVAGDTTNAEKTLHDVLGDPLIFAVRIFDETDQLLIEYPQGNTAADWENTTTFQRDIINYDAPVLVFSDFEEEFNVLGLNGKETNSTIGRVVMIVGNYRSVFSYVTLTIFVIVSSIVLLFVYLVNWLNTRRFFSAIQNIRLALNNYVNRNYSHENLDSGIAELGLVEQHVNELANVLLQSEKEGKDKSTYLATMSHEIRNPLNIVLSHNHEAICELQNPQDDDSIGKSVEHLRVANAASEVLLNLLNNVFDIDKLGAGDQLSINCDPLDIDDVLASCVQLVKAQYPQTTLDIIEPEYNGQPRRFYGDRQRLTQIILNLLTNSFKYTEKGYIELMLDIESLADRRASLTIKVRDTGKGIDSEIRQKVFEKYVKGQGHDQSQGDVYSEGLGLFITKSLVDAIGATINIESLPDVGTLVTVNLVLDECYTEQEHTDAPGCELEYEADMLDQAKLSLNGKSILAVDDVIANISAVDSMLSRVGANVICVTSGKDALMLLAESHYDAIIVDLHMPDMDGYETARKIRQRNETIPIIAFSGNQQDKERSVSCGINDFIAKPFIPNDLFCTLAQHINNEAFVGKSDLAISSEPQSEIDIDYVKRVYSHDDAVIAVDLRCFVSQFRDCHHEMAEHLKSDNLQQLADVTHKLKTAAANIGAENICSIATVLESQTLDFALRKQLIDRLAELIPMAVKSAQHALDLQEKTNSESDVMEALLV